MSATFFSPHRQRGFTLIEIMIAMLIALFLLAGLGTLVAGTRRTGTNQIALAQLQDEERLAMSILTDVIQNAGTYDTTKYYTAQDGLPAVAAGTVPAMAQGQGITGTHSTALPGDTIVVRYGTASGDGVMNCTGGTNTSGTSTTYTNYFFILVTGSQTQLRCSPSGAATGIALVDNVANMQIYYGVVTAGGTMTSVDTYMTANQLTASNWMNVTSARVTLAFINPLAGQPGQNPYVFFTRVIPIQPRAGAVFP